MTHDDPPDEREQISRMEAIAYIESLLPELVTLAASEPHLQHALRTAHVQAGQIVAGFRADPLWAKTAPPASEVG